MQPTAVLASLLARPSAADPQPSWAAARIREEARLKKTIATALAASAVIGALFGCATTRHAVNVDSITSPDAQPGSTYILVPGREGVAASDLQYREFAAYVDRALQARGFAPASSPDRAEMAVLLNYGIGEPQTTSYTYSLPIYGQTGGGTATYSGSTYGSGGYAHTTGTVHQQPTYGVVGSQTHTGSVTTYLRYLVLDAVSLAAYRESQTIVPLWKTTVTSTGSSGDLRLVLPVLVGAASEHLATNTGQQVHIKLTETDRRVLKVKGQ